MSSDSDEDSSLDFLRPNGFEDVAVENVCLHFSRQSSATDLSSPSILLESGTPKKRKLRSSKKDTPDKTAKKDSGCISLDNSDIVLAESPSDLGEDKDQCEESITVDSQEIEAVVDLDAISSPSPTEASSYHFSESISLSDDELGVIPDTAEDLNPELIIRVIWKSNAIGEFKIRKFQKLKEIYTHYADLEGVPEERILITLKEREISPNDTPESINIGRNFLEGGVIDTIERRAAVPQQPPSLDPSMLEIKVQQKGVKEKHSVYISHTDNMQVLLSKLAEDLRVATSTMKLYFDGEQIELSETPGSLDLEGGECFDLVIKS